MYWAIAVTIEHTVDGNFLQQQTQDVYEINLINKQYYTPSIQKKE